MSKDPVQNLTDTLALLRLEIADVKKRQITEERLKHLQAALENTAQQVGSVQKAATYGGMQGAKDLSGPLSTATREMGQKVDKAVQSLLDARREASGTILARRRNVWLLMAFSAFSGLAIGALGSLMFYDYHQARDFGEAIQGGVFDEFACEGANGFITDQESGKFCAIEMKR